MTDWELIQEFAKTRSQTAFATLVSRYVDFVYSAALRQVGNRHLAEDVTQGVFLILSQKAPQLAKQPPGILTGWLFNVARFTSLNAMKSERRRRIYEEERQKMSAERTDEAPADWEAISPHLDAALMGLGSTDRDAVLLRFFSGKSHRDIALALGMSEDAARKRIGRSIEKLRHILGNKGVSLGSMALAGHLTSNAVQAAPAALSGACSAGICSAGGAALAKGAILMMAAKTKMMVASILAILFLAGAGGLVVQKVVQAAGPGNSTVQQPVIPAAPIAAIAPPVAGQTAISGIVKSSSGEPIGGAEVLLATEKRRVDAYAAKPASAGRALSADDGSFSFNAPDGHSMVIVRHQLGYAQVTREQLDASGQINLQPWARVEGIAKIGSAPAAGARVILSRFSDSSNPYTSLVTLERQTHADAQGHYSFDQVAPGDAWVYRRVEPQGYLATLAYVDAQAGKTMKVALGGNGRPVIGRIVLPKDSDIKLDWRFGRGSSFTAGMMPGSMPFLERRPELAADLSWEEKRIACEAWGNTVLGLFAKRNNYGVSFWINPDGSFRIDDVSTGLHRFSITLFHEDSGSGYYDRVASTDMPITIGDLSAQGGQTDQPLDLGTLTMRLDPCLRVGRPAPQFLLKKLDGAEVKLSDFAGKFVLLVPWSNYKPLTNEDIDFIKLAHKKNAKDGKLVIITVEFEDDADAAKDFAKATGLGDIAINCTTKISRGGVSELFNKYRIPLDYFQAPSVVSLIDPEGKISAKNLAGESIEGAVYRAIFERQ